MRPLEGYKVLDFSTLLPGPLATLLLAEAGAEVLKIERPDGGDDLRRYQPRWGRDGVGFALLNRGKRGLALDLKEPGAVARLTPLIEAADVLVEQFRPGVMDRLGLGYQAVKAINPGLVYCSITGYGQRGPKSGSAGHDLNYVGDTGLLALGSGGAERPVIPPGLIADIAGGSYPAVMNILMALLRREKTGEGARLDIAMCDGLFPFMFWAYGEGLATGDWPENGAGPFTGGSPRYQLYPTADGRLLAAAPLEDRFWRIFCAVIEAPEDIDIAGVRAIVVRHPAEYWRARFEGRDCCCSIVASLAEALRDPQFRDRGLFEHRLENETGERLPALPLPLAPGFRAAPDQPLAAPALGEDEEESRP